MGGKAARTKGHAHERYVAIKLREIDSTARRNVEETQVASVDIKTKLPLAIQCKCLKNWSMSPHAIFNQAATGALHKNDMPVGVVRITKKSPVLAIIAFDHLLEMLERIYGKASDRDSELQCQSWSSLSETTHESEAPEGEV